MGVVHLPDRRHINGSFHLSQPLTLFSPSTAIPAIFEGKTEGKGLSLSLDPVLRRRRLFAPPSPLLLLPMTQDGGVGTFIGDGGKAIAPHGKGSFSAEGCCRMEVPCQRGGASSIARGSDVVHRLP